MNRVWLIRTKNNHILGPVTKEKIQELIANGTIKGDDEVCSGNGYWVYVREQDLIAKYVVSAQEQGFNPVQEAEPVELADFPPKDIELDLKQSEENESGEDGQDQENEHESDHNKEKKTPPNESFVIKAGKTRKEVDSNEQRANKKKFNLSLFSLYLLAFLFLIIAVLSFYYKEELLREINQNVSIELIPKSYAQTYLESPKKKNG